jgi:hypothetical protein
MTVLAGLAGCTSHDNGAKAPGADGAEADPDLALLAQSIADKQDLLAAYAATLDSHSPLASLLGPLQLDHGAHLGALRRIQAQKAGGPELSTPGPSASASPTGPLVPAKTDAAVEALAAVESAAAGRRIGQCRSARDADLARLLASIGGCEAAHAAVLRTPRPRAGTQ